MDRNKQYKNKSRINKTKRDKARAFMEEEKPRTSATAAFHRKPYLVGKRSDASG